MLKPRNPVSSTLNTTTFNINQKKPGFYTKLVRESSLIVHCIDDCNSFHAPYVPLYLMYLLITITVIIIITYLLLDKLAQTSKFQLFGQYFTKVNTQELVVALTYDDGPNPPYTDQLINLLNQLGVKATFFTIGQNIEAHTQTIQSLVANTHEIGNHSYSHQKLIWKTPAFIRSEINKTDELIRKLGVKQEILFRAPYGYKRFTLPYILNKMQKKNILWNLDPKDYHASNPEVIANYVISNVTPGAIILLHDGGGERGATIAATEIIVRTLQAQGYKFQTVSQMLK